MGAAERHRTQAGDAHGLGQHQVEACFAMNLPQIGRAAVAELNACFVQLGHFAGLDQNVAVFPDDGGSANAAAKEALDASGAVKGERLELLDSSEGVLPIGAFLHRQGGAGGVC